MALLTKIDWNIINNYIKEGLLIKNKHPIYDIWILNYSKTCQFDKAWDDVTLSCRGLVVDGNGDIIARPFKKFFNMEEHINDPSLGEIPYGQAFEVFEKMDGSLGIFFYYKEVDQWIFASRGSFESEQAIKGEEILRKHYNLLPLDKSFTYLFEIIYPKNRIVVDYGGISALVMLGAIHTATGAEMSHKDMRNKYEIYNYKTVVSKYNDINDISDIRKQLEDNSNEGVVVRFSNGFRMKIKWSEYIRLHRIVTNISSINIWDTLRKDIDISDIINNVPDEFFDFVQNVINDLNEKYNYIELQSLKMFWKIYFCDNNKERKSFALEAKKSEYLSILFKLYDGKEYSDIIWKMIKPEYAQPFRANDGESG